MLPNMCNSGLWQVNYIIRFLVVPDERRKSVGKRERGKKPLPDQNRPKGCRFGDRLSEKSKAKLIGRDRVQETNKGRWIMGRFVLVMIGIAVVVVVLVEVMAFIGS